MMGIFDAILDGAVNLLSSDAQKLVSKGIEFADNEDYDTAIELYTEAIELEPDEALAYYWRGIAYAYKENEEYDRAIADFNRAIKLDPDNSSAYGRRGDAYTKKGEYDRAIADYNRVIKLEPDEALWYSNRGLAYKRKGEYDRAIADFTQAIELDPDDDIAAELWEELKQLQKKGAAAAHSSAPHGPRRTNTAGSGAAQRSSGVKLGSKFGRKADMRPSAESSPHGLACPNCGASAPAGSKFCNECGSPVTPAVPVCAACGAELPEGSKFCNECGSKVEE